MSKKPEIRSIILAIICEGNTIPCSLKKVEIPKKMLDNMANANAIILQYVGDKPSEPKLFPISVVMGTNFSLNLLSKYSPITYAPGKYSLLYRLGTNIKSEYTT